MIATYLLVVAAVLWIACDDDVPNWVAAVPLALVLAPVVVLLIAAAPLPNRTPKDARP